MKNSPTLSLADLDNYDPQTVGGTRRLCPLCGQDKPRDSAHRSVQVETSQGLWHCHRCQAGGKLREFWTERPFTPLTQRQFATAQMQRVFHAPQPAIPKSCDPVKEALWREQLNQVQPLLNCASSTRSVNYLVSRGLSPEIAQQAGVRHLENWFGRPALVFPSRAENGVLVGAQGRYIDGQSNPKARTAGSGGVFATHGAWNSPLLILTEAPLDALSLALCGFPAIAVFGCNLPTWIHRRCVFRQVAIATDADKAGDQAAAEWTNYLANFGAQCRRLNPAQISSLYPAKDWNELLQAIGAQALGELLQLV